MIRFIGCLWGCYVISSLLTAVLVGTGMCTGTVPVTLLNITAPLWMPILVVVGGVVALSPVLALIIIGKIIY